MEHAVQHLCLLEFTCDIEALLVKKIKSLKLVANRKLNAEATEFRPTRKTAALADLKFRDVIQDENQPAPVE